MLQSSSQLEKEISSPASARTIDIQQLHDRCGVYTQPALVRRTLDACGWTCDVDLSRSSLLEPCAGDGSFVVEAAIRLLRSLTRIRIVPNVRTLKQRILAYELVRSEAAKSRKRIAELLIKSGLRPTTSMTIARAWIRTGDFLLDRPRRRRFTHVVGNPPFVRWSLVPKSLRSKYELALRPEIARGDLQLPFLSEGVGALAIGGRLAYICSNRWRHMGYGETFKADLYQRTLVHTYRIQQRTAFSRRVSAYADLLVVTNSAPPQRIAGSVAVRKLRTLLDFGCSVRVGPALGCEDAFVGSAADLKVEPELLGRFVRPRQVREGEIDVEDLWVIAMHDAEGRLRDLAKYPRLAKHLELFSERLRARSIVGKGSVWYRPIDRVRKESWSAPKLLVPEIAKVPRIAMDDSGLIPSHGVYAIFGPANGLREVGVALANGGLERSLKGIAPRINGGYVRCYRRFLELMQLQG